MSPCRPRQGRLRPVHFLSQGLLAHVVRIPRPDRPDRPHPRRPRLPHPHRCPGTGDSRRAGWTRRNGRRPDRDWQDRQLHPADPAAPGQERRGEPECGAGPDPGADPRTGRAGARKRAHLCRRPAAAHHGRLWRGEHQSADDGAAQGRRRDGRHPGPPARPAAPERGALQRGQDPGAGRSRPHARPGFCARTRRHHETAAQEAPDLAVLGHLLGPDPGAVEPDAA